MNIMDALNLAGVTVKKVSTTNGGEYDEDSVGDFIHECCIVGDDYTVSAAAVYEQFEEWWKENVSNRVPKKKRFGQWFSARFEKVKSGRIRYLGVGLREDREDCG